MDVYGSFSVYTKARSMNYLLGTYKYNIGSFKVYTCNYCQFFCFTADETEARALNHLSNNWVIKPRFKFKHITNLLLKIK